MRASAIVQSLLSFARKREPHLRPQSVAWVLEKALALKQDHNGASGVAMTQEWRPTFRLQCSTKTRYSKSF